MARGSRRIAAAAIERGPDRNGGDLEARIERAIARQIGPLREELANYDDKVRWHDVLGGLGYILGITGLGCWLIERRRRAR